MFEHVIRYDDGITSGFVLASCSVPVNYDYTKLNVQDHKLVSNEILQIQSTNMFLCLTNLS